MVLYLEMILTSKASDTEIKSVNYGAYFEHVSGMYHGSE